MHRIFSLHCNWPFIWNTVYSFYCTYLGSECYSAVYNNERRAAPPQIQYAKEIFKYQHQKIVAHSAIFTPRDLLLCFRGGSSHIKGEGWTLEREKTTHYGSLWMWGGGIHLTKGNFHTLWSQISVNTEDGDQDDDVIEWETMWLGNGDWERRLCVRRWWRNLFDPYTGICGLL